MASAFFNRLADPQVAQAISAGTQPAAHLHPEVVEAMNEAGFDLSGILPRLLTGNLARQASVLITMGCGEACPVVPGLRTMDWDIPDPKGQPPSRVREIRDTIKTGVTKLLKEEGWEK